MSRPIASRSSSARDRTARRRRRRLTLSSAPAWPRAGGSSITTRTIRRRSPSPAGRPTGATVLLNRSYVEADRRIVLGFIEPHFMAGFSGGYKGVFPAVAGIDAIMHYHRAAVIGDPRSTWGVHRRQSDAGADPLQRRIAARRLSASTSR